MGTVNVINNGAAVAATETGGRKSPSISPSRGDDYQWRNELSGGNDNGLIVTRSFCRYEFRSVFNIAHSMVSLTRSAEVEMEG